jgi:hypothetical protein
MLASENVNHHETLKYILLKNTVYQTFRNIFTRYSISFFTVNMFFHISSVWVQDKTGNPYGQPVKYSDLLFSGVSLKKEMPIGSK